MRNIKAQRGEGETGFIAVVIGLAILISVTYFTIGWIKSVKEARARARDKQEKIDPPPKSLEDIGSYEVTY